MNSGSHISMQEAPIETRLVIAYALIALIFGAAMFLVVRFRKERARRRDMRRGKYRDEL